VFTNTRVMADRLNGVLRAVEGLRVYVLHREKDQKERKLAIERFKQGGKGVLVATDVAARGLDISELDLVINFDMPRSGDDYLHRVGRTGRAGAEGLAVSLVAPHERSLMSSIGRYLRRQFERREIKELAGSFKGPKKVKASGKPVGAKKKKDDKQKVKRPKTAKPAARRKPAIPKGQVVLDGGDGLAPPKRRSGVPDGLRGAGRPGRCTAPGQRFPASVTAPLQADHQRQQQPTGQPHPFLAASVHRRLHGQDLLIKVQSQFGGLTAITHHVDQSAIPLLNQAESQI